MSDITGITTQSSTTDGATALAGLKTAIGNLNTGKAEISGQVFTGAISASNLSGTNTGDETTTTTGALINGATAKATPIDADFIGLMDSAASNILKKLSWLNIKATLKAYFDTLYPSGSGTSTGSNTGDQTISDATISTSNITTNNVSVSKHGFAPILPNDATKYFDGSGNYSVPPSGTTNLTFNALESGTKADVMAINSIANQSIGVQDNTPFGKLAANETKQGFRIVGSGVAMSSLKVNLRMTGSPADNAVIRVETDSGTAPSGTLANVNATANVAGGGLTGSYVDTTVTFAGSFTLTLGTVYWLVFTRSGATANTNFYFVGTIALNIATFYSPKSFNGTVWSVFQAWTIYMSSAAGILFNGVYKNTATSGTDVISKVVGVASANYSAGGTATIVPDGQVASGFTGLSPGAAYVPGASGALGTGTYSPGSSQYVGIAMTDTTLLVKIGWIQ